MKVEFTTMRPLYRGNIVQEYLKTLTKDVEYKAWTVNDRLELEPCIGIIESDGSYNYHQNVDDSQHVLKVFRSNGQNARWTVCQWFTLEKQDALNVQKLNLDRYKEQLGKELFKVNQLINQNVNNKK